MEEIHNKSYCKIYYLSDQKCVFLKWEQYMMSSQFQKACNLALEILKQERLSNMIVDNQNIKVLKNTDEDWLSQVWTPKAIAAGFRTNAIIESNEKFEKLSTKDMTIEIDKDLDDYFNVNYVQNFDEALAWIEKMNTQKGS